MNDASSEARNNTAADTSSGCAGLPRIVVPKRTFVISGDALFKNTVGRTDIPGADHELLIRQIKSELYTLPLETVVLPGHGADTTIGAEVMSNPHTR